MLSLNDPQTLALELKMMERLVERYGAQYNITLDSLDRIGAGTATDADLLAISENANTMIKDFRDDLRTKDPEMYEPEDLKLLMATVDRNARYIDTCTEIRKVIPSDGVRPNMDGAYPKPGVVGFCAPGHFTEDLSPQQTEDQLGLDYTTVKDGKTVTPFLDANGKPKPFLFVMRTPVTKEMRERARIPIDPRQLKRFVDMAESGTPGDRVMAQEFLARNGKKFALIFKDQADEDFVKSELPQYLSQLRKDPLPSPYTGNTVPLASEKRMAQGGYSDILQETYFPPPPAKLGGGSTISVLLPQEGRDPEHPSNPGGNRMFDIARWNNGRFSVDEQKHREAEKYANRIFGAYDEPLRKAFREECCGTIDKVKTWHMEGLSKRAAAARPNVETHLRRLASSGHDVLPRRTTSTVTAKRKMDEDDTHARRKPRRRRPGKPLRARGRQTRA